LVKDEISDLLRDSCKVLNSWKAYLCHVLTNQQTILCGSLLPWHGAS